MTDAGKAAYELAISYGLAEYYIPTTGCIVVPIPKLQKENSCGFSTLAMMMKFLYDNPDWVMGYAEDGAVDINYQCYYLQSVEDLKNW